MCIYLLAWMLQNVVTHLLDAHYTHLLHVKLFVNHEDLMLCDLYQEAAHLHNISLLENPQFDAGFDVFCPPLLYSPIYGGGKPVKIDMGIQCEARLLSLATGDSRPSGFFLYPRSSLAKTPLRLANSVGIIDSGYRGNIAAMFDCHGNGLYSPDIYSRLVQLCAPGLVPFYVEIVTSAEALSSTARGVGGFGSTGLIQRA